MSHIKLGSISDVLLDNRYKLCAVQKYVICTVLERGGSTGGTGGGAKFPQNFSLYFVKNYFVVVPKILKLGSPIPTN